MSEHWIRVNSSFINLSNVAAAEIRKSPQGEWMLALLVPGRTGAVTFPLVGVEDAQRLHGHLLSDCRGSFGFEKSVLTKDRK